MISATLEETDGNWLGTWLFDVLPRVGEIPSDRYEVIGVEHWPALADLPPKDRGQPGVRLYVELLPGPAARD